MPQGITVTLDIVAVLPACEPVSILIVLPLANQLIEAVVVAVVVVPPFAVTALLHLCLVPQAQAPNVPAKAPDGICTQASSSWWYRYCTVAEDTNIAKFNTSLTSVTTKLPAVEAVGVGVIICRDFLLTTGMFQFVNAMVLLSNN